MESLFMPVFLSKGMAGEVPEAVPAAKPGKGMLLAVLAIAAIAAALLGWLLAPAQPAIPSDWLTYSNPEHNYSIRHAPQWEKGEASGGASFRFTVGNVSHAISVSGSSRMEDYYVSGRPPTFEEFKARWMKYVEMTGAEVVGSVENARLGGAEAFSYRMRGMVNLPQYAEALQIAAMKDGRVYTIAHFYGAPDKTGEELFNKVAGSFRQIGRAHV
jgi:hypothetical protein